MKPRKYRYFVGDFETTVYKGQVNTEVWASASVEMYTEDVHIFHSIEEQFDYFKSLDCNLIVYYHNLKFDGSFWLSALLVDLGLEQAGRKTGPNCTDFQWDSPKDMRNNTFQYSISEMGQWYRIIIKTNNHIIELRDSLKLLPFSVKKIGKDFKTKHQKLDMEYEGIRYAGCEITQEEQAYIANDVLVIKEALEIMFDSGHTKLTIGSCCLAEYRQLLGRKKYNQYYPNVYDMTLNEEEHGSPTVGDWIHRSYRGGWCYLARGKERRLFHNGTTADVNSLYPSMMSSESLNTYPIGEPTFWTGDFIPDEALDHQNYYFIRIKTRFYLKPGMLPFIQIKNTLLYRSNEMLETSDVPNADGEYQDLVYDFNGELIDTRVELTLTMTDFQLIKEHYNLVDCEILDGCYFQAAIGIFDVYIDKYKKIKLESKGAMRQIAKLFLNNLYGKMASSKKSSFKIAYVKPDKSIGFETVLANDKVPGYIPVGSAITSYARNFTIRAAQKNYHGPDKPGFIYADTDSIHCDLLPEQMEGIKVHDKNFCCWKLESCWDEGWFVRQKTYIEHVTHEDLEPVDAPYYSVRCAGMPDRCKELFVRSMNKEPLSEEEQEQLSNDEKDFLKTERTVKDFDYGLLVPGKLLPKRIRGGILLVDGCYMMRG